jgi:hypothetical protein
MMAKSIQGNPWLHIWFEPKKTIRSIVNTNPKYGFLFLSAVYGLPLAFNLAQTFALTPAVPLWAIVIGSFILCTFLGIIGISVSAWLLQLAGRWIGGKGNFQEVRAAVAWSNVPNCVTVIMWFILLGIFGSQAFSHAFPETQFVGYLAGILFLIMLIETIVSVWGFIILLNTLAEVQGFSVWRAILNVIIPFVAVVAIIWIFWWIIMGTGTLIHS